MVRSREAWIEGIRPRTLGRERVAWVSWPVLPPFVGIGESNLKGYSTVFTIDLDIVDVSCSVRLEVTKLCCDV